MAHPALTDSSLLNELSAWVANSTKSLKLKLVHPVEEDDPSADDTGMDEFHPEFTYPLFGEQEMIYGYKNLDIKLFYASGSLATYFDVSYSSKISESSTASSSKATAAAAAAVEDDVVAKMREFIPHDYITNHDVFMHTVRLDARSFVPLGEKIYEYRARNEGGETEFEIYQAFFESPKFRAYHKRLQTFILFFIEGTNYVDDEDMKWEIYTLYSKEMSDDGTPRYHIVGYATAYPFFCFPDSIRIRISQFLILPPYQSQGHGIEDPNDAFSDLRDKNDMRYLLERDAFQGLKAPVARTFVEEMRKKFKLTKRQAQRCIEIYLLKKLNKTNTKDYKDYRLQVKERLYKFNQESLKQLEHEERIEKLHETYQGIEEDYHRILNLL
ncbi:acyl-CoA N-acyltransferase [Jimgerdemannia flammicorona]|uniref:Histone acetyltransferase type B catalytic subunit n=1 Tax=Jimgerdemannia flammicorona TaxID=994334 RepID=A0A433DCC3_9FUNG|nr:acyl-CoA N-acyltransferase [Jimgerdemannia flammicorona]